MATTYFRGYRGRVEHITTDLKMTLCGLSARPGARYTDAERGGDKTIRPTCPTCRAVAIANSESPEGN